MLMIKIKSLLVLAIFFSFSAFASGELPFLSIKERLRLHLWSYGLEEVGPIKTSSQKPKILPEEIERPLKKL